jgi:hypothetical protein
VIGIGHRLVATDVPQVNIAIREYKMRGRDTFFRAAMAARAAAANVSQRYGIRIQQVRDFELR